MTWLIFYLYINMSAPVEDEKKPKTFTLEPDVALKASPAAESTKKLYRGKLNAITKLGLAGNRAELKKNHKAVIAYIEKLYPDDENGRYKKRFIVYSIFWSMDAAYLKKKNWYYKYLQKILPIKHTVTGEAWMPIDKYKEKQAAAKIDEDDAPA